MAGQSEKLSAFKKPKSAAPERPIWKISSYNQSDRPGVDAKIFVMKVALSHLTIEVLSGNIAAQVGITAVVNAANAQLLPGGGVAGAIHRAAGPGLQEECHPLAPIRPGEAVLTGGHNLPNPYVIHCLGPVYGQDSPADKLLASCYRNALRLADRQGIESIAFPSISTGVFGYPMEAAAEIAFRTVIREDPNLTSLRLVRFVLFGSGALAVHEEVLRWVLDSLEN